MDLNVFNCFKILVCSIFLLLLLTGELVINVYHYVDNPYIRGSHLTSVQFCPIQ
jgi:hypothetical protein